MGHRGEGSRGPLVRAMAGGAVILAISLYGFFLLRARAGLPVPPDKVLAVEGVRVQTGSAVDVTFLLRAKKPGDPVRLTVRGESGRETDILVDAAAYYPGGGIPLLFLVIGGVIAGLGIATLLLRPANAQARMFYWTCLAFALATIVSGPEYCLGSSWTSLLPCAFFIVLYAMVPAAFLHLCLLLAGRISIRPAVLYALPAVLAAWFLAVFLGGALKPSLPYLRLYEKTYFLQRLMVILFLTAAAAVLVQGYRRPISPEVRPRIQWVFLGFVLGLAPFVFLYELPRVVLGALGRSGARPLLSEDVSSLFFIFVPLSFAVAIVRHRMWDIEVAFSRGLVYSIFSAAAAGIYLLLVVAAQKLFSGPIGVSEPLAVAAAVLLAAIAFNPLARRLQDLVDRAFFRRRYDLRQAVLAFAGASRVLAVREDLLDAFLSALRAVLPTARAGVFIRAQPPGAAPSEPAAAIHRGDAFDEALFAAEPCEPGEVLARPSACAPGLDVDFGLSLPLAGQGLDLAAALAPHHGAACGWLGLGPKKSGEKYAARDVAFLRELIGELLPGLERIRLQEEVIWEKASRRKSDELNALKTEFISSVSHELRTPMTTIQGLAELLRGGRTADPARRERYADLLAAESGRLSRLIHNVLDYGRIERGAKAYEPRRVVVQEVAAEVVEALSPGRSEDGPDIRTLFPAEPLEILVDPDALKQALINLIDNAAKYSPDDKRIDVEVRDAGTEAAIEVRDRGIGIPAEARERIFESFYRTAEAERLCPRGAGLGLKIVKHIADAHGGRIEVESEVGKGSLFRLLIPKP